MSNLRKFADGIEKAIANAVNAIVAQEADRINQEYDLQWGTEINDIRVAYKAYNGEEATITGAGTQIAFVEFGTGVTYPDTHPKAAEMGAIRGDYGKGYGKQKTWGYYGEPEPYAKYRRTTTKGDLYTTHGMPASKTMYYATVRIKEDLPKAIKEELNKL